MSVPRVLRPRPGLAARLGTVGVLGVIVSAPLLTNVTAAQEQRESTKQTSRPAAERFDLKVRNDFFIGFAGDRDALARGMKACEKALAENPKQAEAMVWHGAGLVFLAGDAFNRGDNQKGTEAWTRGMKEVDEAVKLAPDNVGVRVPRGAILTVASRFVPNAATQKQLLERARSDYERVYAIQKPYLDRLGNHPRGELLFALAEITRRLGKGDQAREYLQLVEKTCKDTPYAVEAKAWLAQDAGAQSAHNCIGCHAPG